jgi:hypothetical protein
VTSLVEAVHEAVLAVPCVRRSALHAPVAAMTRLVYRAVDGITRVTGGGVDALLWALAPRSHEAPATDRREILLAALNGVLGDHLEARDNPLALRMCVRHEGTMLAADPPALRSTSPRLGGRLMLLVHGLCVGPGVWARDGQEHAATLAGALGFTPLHLHYNSGLHISTNGRALAELLDRLVDAWPVPVRELVIIGHSMGGLVARSALHYGASGRLAWRDLPITVIFLGTPHHGAPLERYGHGVDRMLRLSGFTAPFERLGRMRSAGITDLRHGSVLDEDWEGACRFAHAHDTRRVVPLPADVRCFAIAGSLGRRTDGDRTRLVGDGLVPVASALGHHRDPDRTLRLEPSHQWVAGGTHHFDLVRDPAVFRKIGRWLGGTGSGRGAVRLG